MRHQMGIANLWNSHFDGTSESGLTVPIRRFRRQLWDDLTWDYDNPEAKLCISIVLNVEEGGEYTLYNGDKTSEQRLCDLTDPADNRRNLPIEHLYEYGARAGFFRLARLLTDRHLPTTVYAVGQCLEYNPDVCATLKECVKNHNWEIATHAYRWIDYYPLSEEEEQKHMTLDQQAHKNCLDTIPRGYYAGKPSTNTHKLLFMNPDIFYANDIYNDDVPYWMYQEEEYPDYDLLMTQKSRHRPLLAIPYSLVNNDMRIVTNNGTSDSMELVTEIMRGIDFMVEETKSTGTSKMMSIGLHGRLAGQPIRAASYAILFDYIAKLRVEGKIIVQTRWQIAQNMYTNHYPSRQTEHRLSNDEIKILGEPSSGHFKQTKNGSIQVDTETKKKEEALESV